MTLCKRGESCVPDIILWFAGQLSRKEKLGNGTCLCQYIIN